MSPVNIYRVKRFKTLICTSVNILLMLWTKRGCYIAEADPGFQIRGGGAHLKKMRRAEGGAKIFGVFRVKNLKEHVFVSEIV
jgi:hypothetical protein